MSANRKTYVCKAETIVAVLSWCRARYHATYGPHEGERRLRQLRLAEAFDMWLRRGVS